MKLHTFYVIDAENHVRVHAATKPVHVPPGAYRFADQRQLGRLSGGWQGERLVDIWNKLPDTKKVSRFTDRNTAIRRIWGAVQKLQTALPEPRGTAARTSEPARTNPFGARDGTKAGRIIALLTRPPGATLAEIMAETGWQAHSVRGFISGQLSRRLGFRIQSTKHERERVYRIVKGEIA